MFTLIAANTERGTIGPCVTNPATRDITVTASALATLNEISGGRMEMGIGRGDSARRVIGKPPVTVEQMEQACRAIKDLAEGREVDYDGHADAAEVGERARLPVWVAAYGPKALRCAGRVGGRPDHATRRPFIIEWSLRYVREGAEEAGRRFEDIQVMAPLLPTSPTISSTRADQVRWFPALVSNHVVDLVKRYSDTELPQELTDFIAAREHYDYADHGRTGAEHAVVRHRRGRRPILRDRRRASECTAKLRELEALGVHQFNIYSMVDDPGRR